jgi:FixJ family two-component response regulator
VLIELQGNAGERAMYQSPELPVQALHAHIAGEVAKADAARRWTHPSHASATPLVFIVGDDVLEREALESAVRGAGWRMAVFTSEAAFLMRARDLVPSCLVIDVSLAERGDMLLRRPLGAERADVPVVCITAQGDVPMTVRAMKAGAVDVLAKPIRAEALQDAIRHALDLSAAALRQWEEVRQLQDRYASLSHRERQVMELVVSGLLNKQVGGELGISEITVKAHRGKVMRKMNATSLANLVKMAARLDLTPIADSN